ncbi:hypothetical protein ACE1SV_64540 [Streptomyces sp. E-15]
MWQLRGDALIAGAPSSVEEFLASALPLAADGYPVELVVLAVREADSRLAPSLRYARSLHRAPRASRHAPVTTCASGPWPTSSTPRSGIRPSWPSR